MFFLLQVEDNDGQSCLHISSSRGHADMAQVLLGQGASINARDKKGWMALHCAAHAGFLDIVHLLVENGASTVAESNEGHIPLWYLLTYLSTSLKLITPIYFFPCVISDLV